MQAKKPINLYTTNYPAHEGRRWMWFDVEHWREYPPKVGHLPTATFNLLKGGTLIDHHRIYKTKDEAVADLVQTGHVRPTITPNKAKRRAWLEPLDLELITSDADTQRVHSEV